MNISQRFWRGLFFIVLIAALCGGLALSTIKNGPAHAAPQLQAIRSVVISEFRTQGPGGANDEFVELYNPTNTTISIGGWTIRKSSGCGGSPTILETIPAGVSLNPGQYYLSAGLSYSGSVTPDYRDAGNWSIADNGGVAILDNSPTPVVIDQVGMCSTTLYLEGTPLTPLSNPVEQSYERKIGGSAGNCNDTDNNAADFVLNPTSSDPQNLSSPPLACLGVTGVTSSTPNGTYTTGASIDITITFSGVVDVTGSPMLLLETGVTDRTATYTSGSGSNTLHFNYIVVVGDTSSDLDYISTNSLALNGGSIIGAIGNAVLTLPSPGTAGSLGANKNIVIDNGIPPSVVSFTRQTPSTMNTNANSLVFRATFSEAVTNVDSSDFAVTPGTTGTPTTVTPISSNVYDVTISGGDLASFNGTVGLNLSPAQNIIDIAGNALPTTEPLTDETYTVDNTAPDVTVNQAAGQADPTGVLAVNFAVVFSEQIDPTTFTASDITQTGGAGSVTWSIADSGDHTNFTLSAISLSSNGTLVPSIAAGRVTDPAGNVNNASTWTDNSVDFQDNTPPTVTVNQATGQTDPTNTLPIRFTVVFSEPIDTRVFTASDITQSGTATGITWGITDSGDHRTFTLSATTVTGFGTLIPSIAANRVMDLVGNNNLASTSTDNTVSYVATLPTATRTSTPIRTPTKTRTPSRTPTKYKTRTPIPAPPPPLVAINEFVPRPGHDWNHDGVINNGDEYIELLNFGVVNVNLSGYSLDDEVNIGSSPYRLPAITMKPGERIVFYGSQTGLQLSDGGDAVRLNKPNGQLADAYNYSVVRFPDESFCRLPDNGGLDDWNQFCFPTPGMPNSQSESSVNPPTSGDEESLCPIADTLPQDFAFAECLPFGHKIWNSTYWDLNGWFGEKSLPGSPNKWTLFGD